MCMYIRITCWITRYVEHVKRVKFRNTWLERLCYGGSILRFWYMFLNKLCLVCFLLTWLIMGRGLWKGGLMHVRKMSSQISLCSPLRMIRDDIFRLNRISAKKRLLLIIKYHKSGKCQDYTLRKCIKHHFHRARLVCFVQYRCAIRNYMIRCARTFAWSHVL